MSKTTKGTSVLSESNMSLISSITHSSRGTRQPRLPKDSILYSSTIKEEAISEYDHEDEELADSNILNNSILRSEKKVKIVGQYKKQKSPSPEREGSHHSNPKQPKPYMFKKKRESLKFTKDIPKSITSGKRKMRNSTSVPRTIRSNLFPESKDRKVGKSAEKPKPRSSGRKKTKLKPKVDLHFTGGSKLENVPDIGKFNEILSQNKKKVPQMADITRSTILDIRTATFYYLFALANKYADELLTGNPMKAKIEICHFKNLRDSYTVKKILNDFNLSRFAKIERGAARASKDGSRASWVKIDYSWKLENQRYWPSILLKTAAFLKGIPIRQSSFNIAEIKNIDKLLVQLDLMLKLERKINEKQILHLLDEINKIMKLLNYSIPDFTISHIKTTLISFLSCRIQKHTLEKVNEMLVKLFKLERNSESKELITEGKIKQILSKLKTSSNLVYSIITDEKMKITSQVTRDSLYKTEEGHRIYKTYRSDNKTLEVASFRYIKPSGTNFFKKIIIKNHSYGSKDELKELKDVINSCKNSGINNIIVSGLFCYNGTNPTTVIDRAYIKFNTLRDVLTQAQFQGIKIIIEFETKVGTRFPSKKYRGRFLKVNYQGEVTHLKYGIGLSNIHDDMYCLNYADYQNWKLTAGEIKYILRKFKGLIGGICIKDIGLMPLVFQRDFSVLSRKELDGGWTYDERLKKFGYVVKCDPYYYGSNFNKESGNAFLKYLSTEIRNTVEDPNFCFFDDSSSIDQTGNEEFIRQLNSNGIHPMIRGMSLGNGQDHSLSNFQTNFEIQKKWTQSNLMFTFVYDSTQPLTKSTFANLMTIVLSHNHCIYESAYFGTDLTVVQCNTQQDDSTRLSMLRRVPRSDPVDEPEFVDHARYIYIYDVLNKILRESGKESMNMLFCFNGKNLCESSIGFYNEKNTDLIIMNTTGSSRCVLVNLNEVLRIKLKQSQFEMDLSEQSLFLNVKNIKMGTEDLYDFNEVLDNGLVLNFSGYEVKHLTLYVSSDASESMRAVESSKKLILNAIENEIVLKNSFLFREIFQTKKSKLATHQKVELFDHFRNLVDRCKNFNFEKFFGVFSEIKCNPDLAKKFCQLLLSSQTRIIRPNFDPLGEIVFITPEYRGVSKAGGISVMVADLCEQLVLLGCKVNIITPYYNINKKGKTNYLKTKYLFNVTVYLDQKHVFGVHTLSIKGVKIYLLHNYGIFYKLYQPMDNRGTITQISCVGKASLELLCKLKLSPAIVIGNDWFCGLAPAYAKYGHFGNFFKNTTFFHIFHNLGEDYEGRIYPPSTHYYFQDVHKLPREVLIDPFWEKKIINPSRCALFSCDQWATVSNTYKNEIMYVSPLKHLLKRFPSPFGVSNGIERKNKRQRIEELDRVESKEYIQKTFFKFKELNPDLCLFGFIGRITEQKGVYFLLEVIEEVLREHKSFDIQFLVGGKIAAGDPYGLQCKNKMEHIKHQYPLLFWADAHFFFNKGLQLNRGADYGLVPSRFEPGGLVQLEFLVADTPVICAATGGLKDTVIDFRANQENGNGYLFNPLDKWGLKQAIYEAYGAWKDEKKYKKLSQNCFPSVVDVKDMGTSYLKEFHRLRNSLYIAPFKEVEQTVDALSTMNNSRNVGSGCFIQLNREAIPDYEEGAVLVYLSYENYSREHTMQYDEFNRCWKYYFDFSRSENKKEFYYYFEYMNKRLVSKIDLIGFGEGVELFNIFKFD